MPAELLVLRGANGAGKTSLLLALAGILRPTAGKITIAAMNARHAGTDGLSPQLHLLGHQSGLKGQLSVAENLAFWAAVNGGDPALIAPSLDLLGLARLAHLEAGYLSAGQTRRLALARLLVADRPLWLLDEPLAALDAEGERLLETLLTAHLQRGGSAIAATHQAIALPPPANVKSLTLGTAP